ncbi:hypothetical protein OKW38_002672 [Paraburkholderia sp. MM5496-R1]
MRCIRTPPGSMWARPATGWPVPRTADDQPVREFGTMTGDLHAMADWLLTCGVDTVALESTGVYWIPVYEVLERRGLTVWLVDARQMKYVPGRRRRASSKLSPHSCSQRLFICADRRHLDD